VVDTESVLDKAGVAKECRIPSRGLMGLLSWRVRSTVLTWGAVRLATDHTGADTLGDRTKHPTVNSSTMKGPTATGRGGLVSESAGRRCQTVESRSDF